MRLPPGHCQHGRPQSDNARKEPAAAAALGEHKPQKKRNRNLEVAGEMGFVFIRAEGSYRIKVLAPFL